VFSGAELAWHFKEEGNAAYQRGEYCSAIKLYSQAIDEPVGSRDLPTEGPRRVAYLLNRAQAYLKRAELDKLADLSPDRCVSMLFP
jgi:hypothetical protein